MSRIACVGLDAFLPKLVAAVRPDAEVVVVDGAEDAEDVGAGVTAILVAADHPVAERLARSRVSDRVVIVGSTGSRIPASHAGPVLTRPVEPEDLAAALLAVAPRSRRHELRRRLGTLPQGMSSEGLFAAARLSAVAAAAALELTRGVTEPWAVVALAGLAVLGRLWVRRLVPVLVAFDILVTAAVIAGTGGPRSGFLLLAAVVAGEIGYTLSRSAATAVIAVGVAAGIGVQVPEVLADELQATELAVWGLLLPLSAVAGAMGRRIERDHQGTSGQLLRELRGTLTQLLRQAQGVAGALEASTVADQVLGTARDDIGARAGVLLVGDPPVLSVAGSFGLDSPPPPRVILDGSLTGAEIPPAVAEVMPQDRCRLAVLGPAHAPLGLLVVVLAENGREDRGQLERLGELAEEAGLALENVRLFGRIRDLSVDLERQRLARDLHDGVIQSLVHVGFELDLVAQQAGEEIGGEVRRLRGVVGDTVEEVRATVNDLRSARLEEGLGPALQSLVRELASDRGPDVRVRTDPLPQLSPEAELQLLRIAQEALSNAFQHAAAQHVSVVLEREDGHVELEIVDDGRGFDLTEPNAPGRGVGLRAMRERARLLGADLTISPGPVGTTVRVHVPLNDVGGRP